MSDTASKMHQDPSSCRVPKGARGKTSSGDGNRLRHKLGKHCFPGRSSIAITMLLLVSLGKVSQSATADTCTDGADSPSALPSPKRIERDLKRMLFKHKIRRTLQQDRCDEFAEYLEKFNRAIQEAQVKTSSETVKHLIVHNVEDNIQRTMEELSLRNDVLIEELDSMNAGVPVNLGGHSIPLEEYKRRLRKEAELFQNALDTSNMKVSSDLRSALHRHKMNKHEKTIRTFADSLTHEECFYTPQLRQRIAELRHTIFKDLDDTRYFYHNNIVKCDLKSKLRYKNILREKANIMLERIFIEFQKQDNPVKITPDIQEDVDELDTFVKTFFKHPPNVRKYVIDATTRAINGNTALLSEAEMKRILHETS